MKEDKLMHAVYLRALILLLMCIAHGAVAQDITQCDGVLIPTVEDSRSDYALLQAFASVNADALYDAIDKSGSNSISGGGGYGPFSADFQQSSSKSEFSERVEKRLVEEQFQMDESDARAYYRSSVLDAQVRAWSQCVGEITEGGAVLLSTDFSDERGFFLTVAWIPPVGTPTAELELGATGGTISGRSLFSETLSGRQRKTYEVIASPSASVKVFANIAGQTDSVWVTYTPKSPMPSLIKSERVCSEMDPCLSDGPSGPKVLACLSSSERPTEVPPGVWMVHPNSNDYSSAEYKISAIEFGSWSNSECSLSGGGWHGKVGTCETGIGTGWQRCEQVRVEVETYEIEVEAPD